MRVAKQMTVGMPERIVLPGAMRITAAVDGAPLWFETPDLVPVPAAEAFVCALLVPALERGARLALPAPLDPEFHANLARLVPVFRGWWAYAGDVHADLEADAGPAAARVPGAAACFTAGADSFYTLLSAARPPDVLLFVHGYDMPLADRERFEHFRRSFMEVAAATGARPVVVRTNLREHPVAAGVPWERWHGGALAAAGHVCADAIGALEIPPSYRRDRLCAWGSDPRTDPLMSSSRLEIRHPSPALGRVERLAAVGDHPLVRAHLRVCYENRTPSGNCSRCEKCVSTMAALEGLGYLDRSRVFDRSRPLVELIDALPQIRGQGLVVWREILALDHRPEVKAALERLLRRTPGPVRRAWWKLVAWSRGGAADARR